MGIWSNNGTHHLGLGIQLHVHYEEAHKALGRPSLIETELSPVEEQDSHNLAPMPYYTDALVGLSAYKLLVHSKDNLSSNEEALAALLWQRIEPMHEIYHRSNTRIKQFLSTKSTAPTAELVFEQSLHEILKKACTSKGTHLQELIRLLDSIQQLEVERSHPLLFDTKLNFASGTMSILHTVYSLLYNLRALSAIQYNETSSETLYDGLHIDSVKDYFHAPELLTNDTLLYRHIAILQRKGKLSRPGDESLSEAFLNYLPHSYFLLNSLPESFFEHKERTQLEDELYQFQVDWLLGTPAGLLYRIREELIGIREGYQHTFWTELQNEEAKEPHSLLHLQCVLDSEHIKHLDDAA
ncbi:MAG: hypothetical protein RJB66_57 [Pseudomonadota bacterium]|jgi:hypothetical protein